MYWIENIVMRFYLLGMYVINNLRCHYSILSQYLVFSLRIQARVHIYIFCFLSPSIPYTPTPSKNVEIYQRRSILLIKACTEKQRKSFWKMGINCWLMVKFGQNIYLFTSSQEPRWVSGCMGFKKIFHIIQFEGFEMK